MGEYVTESRDALAKALCDPLASAYQEEIAYPCAECAEKADELIASGVVIPADNYRALGWLSWLESSDGTLRCNCSASGPHKGSGADPARCPKHGEWQ